MDPNANLEKQLSLAQSIVDGPPEGENPDDAADVLADRANRLAELVLALDEWRVKGGFLPSRWDIYARPRGTTECAGDPRRVVMDAEWTTAKPELTGFYWVRLGAKFNDAAQGGSAFAPGDLAVVWFNDYDDGVYVPGDHLAHEADEIAWWWPQVLLVDPAPTAGEEPRTSG